MKCGAGKEGGEQFTGTAARARVLKDKEGLDQAEKREESTSEGSPLPSGVFHQED